MAFVRLTKKSYQVQDQEETTRSKILSAVTDKLPVEKRERVYLLGGAILLVLFASIQLFSSSSDSDYVGRDGGASAREYEGRGFQLEHTYTRANPEVPFLERIFCSGRRNSFFCSDTNYHPYIVWWNKFAGLEDVSPREIDSGYREIQKTFAEHQPYEKSSIILHEEDVSLRHVPVN